MIKKIPTMHIPENVFISYACPLENATVLNGYSGTLIGENYILAHGSMLAPLFGFHSRELIDVIESLNFDHLTTIHELFRLIGDLTFRVQLKDLEAKKGKIIFIWKCPLLKNTFDDSLKDWTLDNQRDFDKLLLPVFLIIECKSSAPIKEPKEKISDESKVEQLMFQLAKQASNCKLKKGAAVEVVSTPFGDSFFIDSLSRGIIGNLLGIDECLMQLDVTPFPGCEGSPVFLINDRYVLGSGCKNICGMIIAPSIWCRGEWVNCTFAANLLPLLKSILQSRILEDESRHLTYSTFSFTGWNRLKIASLFRSFINPNSDDTVLEKSIVKVKCGPDRGTGILVDKLSGTFITCAHVVERAPEIELQLVNSITKGKDRIKWFAKADLIYKSLDYTHYDIAVLKIDPKLIEASMEAVRFADAPARKGEQILCAGFPYYLKGGSNFTSGIVSKTSQYMFQTNCRVYSGVSGAPIFRRDNLQMIGIVVCDFNSSNSLVSFPRLCMATPITVLRQPLNDYLQTSDPKTLEKLAQNYADIEFAWNLEAFPSSKL